MDTILADTVAGFKMTLPDAYGGLPVSASEAQAVRADSNLSPGAQFSVGANISGFFVDSVPAARRSSAARLCGPCPAFVFPGLDAPHGAGRALMPDCHCLVCRSIVDWTPLPSRKPLERPLRKQLGFVHGAGCRRRPGLVAVLVACQALCRTALDLEVTFRFFAYSARATVSIR